jgi:hypothetical protein
VAAVVAGESTGQASGQHARAGSKGKVGSRTPAGEGANLVQHVPRITILEPLRDVVQPTGGLPGQVGGRAVLLRPARHPRKLIGQGVQPARRSLLLGRCLIGGLGTELIDQISGLATRFPGHLSGLFLRRLDNLSAGLLCGSGDLACLLPSRPGGRDVGSWRRGGSARRSGWHRPVLVGIPDCRELWIHDASTHRAVLRRTPS